MAAESENWATACSRIFLGSYTIWRQCVVYVTATKKNLTISTTKSCLSVLLRLYYISPVSGHSQDAVNTIRRSASDGDGTKPMTSVIYDVIRLEAVRDSSNVPIEGHFWRFLGNLNPKILSAIVWTPKRHFLTSQRVLWAIVRQNLCTGRFSRRVREKMKKRGLIFHVFRQALPYGRLAQILVTCLSRGR